MDHWAPGPTLLTPDIALGPAPPGAALPSPAAMASDGGASPFALPGVPAAASAALATASGSAVALIREAELDARGRSKTPGSRGTCGPPKPPPAGRPAKAPRTLPSPGRHLVGEPAGNDAIMKNEKDEPPAAKIETPREEAGLATAPEADLPGGSSLGEQPPEDAPTEVNPPDQLDWEEMQ